jgi:hypothetical protein
MQAIIGLSSRALDLDGPFGRQRARRPRRTS